MRFQILRGIRGRRRRIVTRVISRNEGNVPTANSPASGKGNLMVRIQDRTYAVRNTFNKDDSLTDSVTSVQIGLTLFCGVSSVYGYTLYSMQKVGREV